MQISFVPRPCAYRDIQPRSFCKSCFNNNVPNIFFSLLPDWIHARNLKVHLCPEEASFCVPRDFKSPFWSAMGTAKILPSSHEISRVSLLLNYLTGSFHSAFQRLRLVSLEPIVQKSFNTIMQVIIIRITLRRIAQLNKLQAIGGTFNRRSFIYLFIQEITCASGNRQIA